MFKIKSLILTNYSGFKGTNIFDFTNENQGFKPVNVFFGPNGCGKSTALKAIEVLCNAKHYQKRTDESNLLLRKMQFHPDYDPHYAGFTKYEDKMEIIGNFWDGNKDLVVHIKDDDVIRNDLLERGIGNCVSIDADHPMNMNKFQISSKRISLFIDLATTIYGYKCYVEKAVNASGVDSGDNQNRNNILKIYADNIKDIRKNTNDHEISKKEVYDSITENVSEDKLFFYQDFIIEKGDIRVHHKSMSAGEKKIATLLRSLCDPSLIDKSDIVMVDNLEMHVYFKRHKKMVDKLISSFPEKQFIVTTHSGIMIDHVKEAYGSSCLFDIPFIKGQPLVN